MASECKYCRNEEKVVLSNKMIADIKYIPKYNRMEFWTNDIYELYFDYAREIKCKKERKQCKFYKTYITSEYVIEIIKKIILSFSNDCGLQEFTNYYKMLNLEILTNKEKNYIVDFLINSYPLIDLNNNKKLYTEYSYYKLDFYNRKILHNESKKLFEHIQKLLSNCCFSKIEWTYNTATSYDTSIHLKYYLKDLSSDERLSIIKNKCIIFFESCDFLRKNLYCNINSIQSWIDNCEYLFSDKFYYLYELIGKEKVIIKKTHVVQIIKKLREIYSKYYDSIKSKYSKYHEMCIDLLLININTIDSDIIIELIKHKYHIKEIYLRNILSKYNYQEILLNIYKMIYHSDSNFFKIIEKFIENNKYWNSYFPSNESLLFLN